MFAGHQGLNRVVFRGQVRGRLLEPGVYTIVAQSAVGSRRSPATVAVAIDARGVHPTAPVRWRNCDPAAGTAVASVAGNALHALGQRASDVAAAEVIAPSSPERAAEARPPAGLAWLQRLPTSPQLPVLLVVLVLVSFALLGIAAVEPGDTARFRIVRVITRHRGEIAWLGGALLLSMIVFHFLG